MSKCCRFSLCVLALFLALLFFFVCYDKNDFQLAQEMTYVMIQAYNDGGSALGSSEQVKVSGPEHLLNYLIEDVKFPYGDETISFTRSSNKQVSMGRMRCNEVPLLEIMNIVQGSGYDLVTTTDLPALSSQLYVFCAR